MSKLRLLFGVLAVLAAVLTGTSAVAAAPDDLPASKSTTASSPEPPQSFKNDATGRCLDDSDDWGIRAFGCHNDGGYQYWYVYRPTDNIRILENSHTGRCLADVGYGTLFSETCNHGDARQQWRIKRYGDGSIRFENNHYRGFCLDDSDWPSGHGRLRMFPCHDGPWQRWR